MKQYATVLLPTAASFGFAAMALQRDAAGTLVGEENTKKGKNRKRMGVM